MSENFRTKSNASTNASVTVEHDLIQWLRSHAPDLPEPETGIGDDAAVLTPPPGDQLVVSTDSLTEEVHFKRSQIHPSLLGRKALLVNVSDLAAMGARPWFCLLALSFPEDLAKSSYSSALLEGFLGETRRWGVDLVGGNLTGSSVIQVTVTIGGTIPHGQAIKRDGCRDGDSLYLVGHVGRSSRGLQLLNELNFDVLPTREEELLELVEDPYDALCLLSHLLPSPRLLAGGWLRQRKLASSMIDVSDGLVTDLQRLAEASHVKIVIDGPTLELLRSKGGERMTLEQVLHGGEDYALIFSCSDREQGGIGKIFPERFGDLHRLGIAHRAETPAVLVDDGRNQTILTPQGFDHFT